MASLRDSGSILTSIRGLVTLVTWATGAVEL